MSNQNWNDPAGTPETPAQPPYGQPSAPEPQVPGYTAPDTQSTSPYTAPTYNAPTYSTPAYGTPDAPAASPASSTPSYSAPDTTPSYGAAPTYGTDPASTPSYGTPATGGYTAPDTSSSYGAAPTAPAGGYGTPDPAAGYGYTDPNQAAYGATGGYGQSQPGQYGATPPAYGQPTEGYQDPNAAYGAAPSTPYGGAAYPSANVSPYGYDSGYASATPELATFGSRAMGWAIDYAAPGVVYYVLSLVISGVLYKAGGLAGILTFVLWAALVAFMVWNSGYQAGTTGYSLGRKIAKNKLVSEATGQPLGVGQAILRLVCHIVDSVICYVGWLFPLWDSKRQTIADKIVKSVVVADPNAGQSLGQQ